MILFAPPLIRVALVGQFANIDLAGWLGKGYEVKRYTRLDQATSNLPQIIVVDETPPLRLWGQERDRFVPDLEKELESAKTKSSKSRIFIVLPSSAPKGFSPETYSAEVLPLLRQVSIESDTQAIDVQDPNHEAEDIADSVVDFSAQKANWRLVNFDSEEADEGPAANAIDGKLDTYWHTRYSPKDDPYPHQLTVDMGTQSSLAGFRYVPRQDGGINGRVKKFEFYVSLDGLSWSGPELVGTLPNTASPTALHFKAPITARYFRFVALSEQFGNPWATAAEIDILPAPAK